MGLSWSEAKFGVVAVLALMSIMSMQGVEFKFNFQLAAPPYKLNRLIEEATYPNNTKIVVLNRERVYYQGDVLTAVIVARNVKGRAKNYGGDFFRARLVSTRSGEGSSAGHVTDHGNGTYTVEFPLYWAGDVLVMVQLVHPSEAVNVLRRVREVPNKRFFICSFADAKTEMIRDCFSSQPTGVPFDQLCEFSSSNANGSWFCERPNNLSCSTISRCTGDASRSNNFTLALLSSDEKRLFQRPYAEEELDQDNLKPIHVRESRPLSLKHLSKCSWNAPDGLNQGYWFGKVWNSSLCRVRIFRKEDARRCLVNKTLHLQGDSTLRQWYMRLLRAVQLEHHGDTISGPATAKSKQSDTVLHYRFHGVPRATTLWINFRSTRYIADELDDIHGGANTVVVLGLWAHFTPEPRQMFLARLHAIRHAIHRLLHRSPGTQVFVRTGTTRAHKNGRLTYYLRNSDWLAYQLVQEIRQVFVTDKDVVVLDTWDMSVCQWEPDSIHPGTAMVDSQLNMLLSHICPE